MTASTELVCILDGDLDNWEVSALPKEQRDIIEADSFWCLSKFLDGIQDNYIFAQLGIQHKVNQLKELIQRIDGKDSDQNFITSWKFVI